MTIISGLDTSSVQFAIPWPALAARGTRFAVAKCGNGNDAPDPNFRRSTDGARAAGLVVGAYHFIYPLPAAVGHPGRDAVEQARAHFAASGGLGRDAGDLPPCIDVEWPAPQDWAKWGVTAPFARDWVRRYLLETEALHKVTPIMYTYPYWAKVLQFPADFARFPLWAAEYDVLQGIYPWAGYTILQTAGGTSSALSRRFQQSNTLPGGCPVDTDIIASEDILKGLISRCPNPKKC